MEDSPRRDSPVTPGGRRGRVAASPLPPRSAGGDRPSVATLRTPRLRLDPGAVGAGGGDGGGLSGAGGGGGSIHHPAAASGQNNEALWDAAVARMGTPGLLRRLTSPRPPAPGDYAVLEVARADSAMKDTRLALGSPACKGGPEGEAAVTEKLKKKIKDYMKTHLSSERTFFKWVWAGLNLGALGTFALVFFHDEGFPYRLIVTGVAWALALAAALYGLCQFHRRRRALLSVVDDPSTWESPHAPTLVVAAFVLMMVTLIVYAMASGQQFGFQTTTVAAPVALAAPAGGPDSRMI